MFYLIFMVYLHQLLIQKVVPRVIEDMNTHLMLEFTRVEIKAVLDNIDNLKAPGPDGMQSFVYKKYWNFMCDHIVDEFLQVLYGGRFRRLRSQTAQKIYGQLVFECAL
jgi:hypothetical protein